MAARRASSRFCREVNAGLFVRTGVACLLVPIFDFLVAFGINSPFCPSCFSRGNNPYCVHLIVCFCRVRDEEHVGFDHAHGLPARFAIDFAILRGQMMRVVEHAPCGIEADAMLPPVEPSFSRIPGEFHCESRIYGIVYTIGCPGAEAQEKVRAVVSCVGESPPLLAKDARNGAPRGLRAKQEIKFPALSLQRAQGQGRGTPAGLRTKVKQ